MTRTLPFRRILPVATVLVAGVALAACGSDSSSKSSGASTNAQSSSTTAAKQAAVILAKANPDLGTILVDAQGRTVYTLTNNGAAVACTGTCLNAWPPVLLPSGVKTATGSAGVKGLGTAMEASGTQVTSDGLPLYTFQGDSAAGMAKGEGLSSFGGTWHVVKVTGAGATSAGTKSSSSESSTTPTTGAKSSSSGYGY